MSEIGLGCKARDKISGFEGVITSRHLSMDGSMQFGIQPRLGKPEDKHPDAVSFDLAQIELLAKPDSGINVAPHLDNLKFKLGEMVEDRTTGYRGIAMRRTDFINGCVYIIVQGKAKKGEKPPKAEMVEHFLLKRVGPGVVAMLPKVKKQIAAGPAPSTATVRSGGPSRIVESRYSQGE